MAKDRAAHGKKPLKPKERRPEVKESKLSTTDPDSGYMVREGKPKGFFYLDHRTTDSLCNIITDVHITPATVYDSVEWVSTNRLSEQGQEIYKRRKETVERSFADAKQLHGHRHARMRGLAKVREQGLLCAACQNMKKIALAMGNGGNSGPGGQFSLLKRLCRTLGWPIFQLSTTKPAHNCT